MNPTPMEVEPPPHTQQTFQRPPIGVPHYAASQMPMQPAGLNGAPFPPRPAVQSMPPPMSQPQPSGVPSQTQPNQPQRRIQTPADLKGLLMAQLKDSFPKYFDLLKQFVNGKVPKPDFETELRKILPEKLKYATLKAKMEKIARSSGLTTVQPECVPVVLTALDHVLTAFMYKSDSTRAKRTLPGPKYIFDNDVMHDGNHVADLNYVAQHGNNGRVTPVIDPSVSPLQLGVPTEYVTNPMSMHGMEVIHEVTNTITREDLVQALRQRPQLQLIGSNMLTVAELLHSYEE